MSLRSSPPSHNVASLRRFERFAFYKRDRASRSVCRFAPVPTSSHDVVEGRKKHVLMVNEVFPGILRNINIYKKKHTGKKVRIFEFLMVD